MLVVKSNEQKIYGLTPEQCSVIKDSLTFDNPDYNKAKKYSRSGYTNKPKYLTYYTENSVRDDNDGVRKKVLSVPVGFDVRKFLKNSEIQFKDERVDNHVKYPKFNLELRKDQSKAEKEYFKTIKEEYPKNIIQLPTGKGKSILALHIAQKLKQKTLILVHKDDLVVGWTNDIKLCFGDDIDIGLIKAKKRKVGEQITIATVQTLGKMSEEELSKYVNEFGLVVQDEVHHCGINIFNVIHKFNSRYKLGLSATPKRSDELDFVFDLFFGGICYVHEITEDDEDICGCEVRVLDSNYRYEPFVYDRQVFNYYDFKTEELPMDLQLLRHIPYKERPRVPFLEIDDKAVKSSKTKVVVCKKIIEHYRQGHSILALFTQKEHINLYYEYLCRYIPKDKIALYYGDSKEKSEDLMNKAENREVLVTLATYAKATEGTNVKAWEVEFLVSSLNNEKNVEQAVGRIRRRKEGKLNTAIVYDVRYSHCYSLSSHFNTRRGVYRKLKFKVIDKTKGIFSRGY